MNSKQKKKIKELQFGWKEKNKILIYYIDLHMNILDKIIYFFIKGHLPQFPSTVIIR